MIASITIRNVCRDLFSVAPKSSHLSAISSYRQGPFHNAFEDFRAVRVRDSYSKIMLFYGIVHETMEQSDLLFGKTLVLHAQDYLSELKENTLKNGLSYKIDNSVALHISLQGGASLKVCYR